MLKRWREALRWALTARPARPDISWFWRRGSPPPIGYDSDLLLICGVLLAISVGLGLLFAGMEWLGLLAFLSLVAWFTRAAHRLEGTQGDLIAA